jgi:DNA-directed RNA polymerase specialized sigma24 family protein
MTTLESTLLDQYEQTVKVIKRELPRKLRSAFDAEDFVQEAIYSILIHSKNYDINRGSRSIGRLMFIIAKRKMHDKYRKKPVVLLDIADLKGKLNKEFELIEIKDSSKYLMSLIKDKKIKKLLKLRGRGFDNKEASIMLGFSIRTAERYIQRVREEFPNA